MFLVAWPVKLVVIGKKRFCQSYWPISHHWLAHLICSLPLLFKSALQCQHRLSCSTGISYQQLSHWSVAKSFMRAAVLSHLAFSCSYHSSYSTVTLRSRTNWLDVNSVRKERKNGHSWMCILVFGGMDFHTWQTSQLLSDVADYWLRPRATG